MLGLQRFAFSLSTPFLRRAGYSTTVRPAALPPVRAAEPESEVAAIERRSSSENIGKPRSAIVAAAFESIRDDLGNSNIDQNQPTEKKEIRREKNDLNERIINAKTVNSLLAVTDNNWTITRSHALKIVSILAEWSIMKRAKLSDFENDSRFIRMCRILGRTAGATVSTFDGNNRTGVTGLRTDDLNTVLGVAGDDEAAKLIASISLPQMVKVLSALAQRKRRSTPLLRSLAYNISSATDQLDLKQCADVLFAMATLNFKDSVLAAKICVDIQSGLPKNVEKSAAVGSIITSLGILKYRDLEILESLTQWFLKNGDVCRQQDVSALLLTSAMLNFKSAYIEDVRTKLVPNILKHDFSKPVDWLNHVLALAMLGLVENSHLENVLSQDFINQLCVDKEDMSPTSKMKLLNLNSFARIFMSNYQGPTIALKNPVYDVRMVHSKSKQTLLNGMIDALKSLLPSNNHIRTLVDSKMGFLIDALCLFDANRNPLPFDDDHSKAIKIALMVVDFHDTCHGTHRTVSGLTKLSFDLLEKCGYKVLPVPYNEFNNSDKLLKRVQYLEGKFKTIIRLQ